MFKPAPQEGSKVAPCFLVVLSHTDPTSGHPDQVVQCFPHGAEEDDNEKVALRPYALKRKARKILEEPEQVITCIRSLVNSLNSSSALLAAQHIIILYCCLL